MIDIPFSSGEFFNSWKSYLTGPLTDFNSAELLFPFNSWFIRYLVYIARVYCIRTLYPSYPGGSDIPGNDDKWNVGTGAGMYLNATQEPWSKNYQMYSYVVSELPAIIEENFPVLPDKCSIFGHRWVR